MALGVLSVVTFPTGVCIGGTGYALIPSFKLLLGWVSASLWLPPSMSCSPIVVLVWGCSVLDCFVESTEVDEFVRCFPLPDRCDCMMLFVSVFNARAVWRLEGFNCLGLLHHCCVTAVFLVGGDVPWCT